MKSLLLVRLRHVDLLTNFAVRNFIFAAIVVADSAPLLADTSPTLRLADAGDMSHLLAALQYAVSLTAIQELRRVAETHPPAPEGSDDQQDPATSAPTPISALYLPPSVLPVPVLSSTAMNTIGVIAQTMKRHTPYHHHWNWNYSTWKASLYSTRS